MAKRWFSTAEAAEIMGVTPTTIARQCRQGQRRCRKVKAGWQVLASEVQRVRDEHTSAL